MRREVSTIRQRPITSRIKEVTHHEADARVEIEMEPGVRPHLHLWIQDLPHLFITHPAVSLVPVMGFGWIQSICHTIARSN